MAFHSSRNLSAIQDKHENHTMAREDSLFKFKVFMRPQVQAEEESGCTMPARQHFEDFKARWKTDNPFGVSTWFACRGPCGGTVLHWLFNLQYRYRKQPPRVAAYKKTMMEILKEYPLLAGVPCEEQPFLGQTILHQACAHGDEEVVRILTQLKRLPLETRAVGKFFLDLQERPESLPYHSCFELGQTALELAVFSLGDEEASKKIVALLLEAGAHVTYRHSAPPHAVKYTLLHRVAASRWEGKGPYMISSERTKTVIRLLLDPRSDHCALVDPRLRDSNGLTAIDVAAMMGNTDALCDMLEWSRVQVWEWGHKKEYGFPLDLLDCGPRGDHGLGALQSAALYRHGPVMSLGLMALVIEKKWATVAAKPLLLQVIVTIIIGFFTAVVCVEDSHGLLAHQEIHMRLVSRYGVIILSTLYALWMCSQLAMAYISRDRWFMSLSLWPWNSKGKLCIWEVFPVRNLIVVLAMLALVLSAPEYWNQVENSFYRYVWDWCASLSWFVFSVHSLCYFELFEFTGPLAAALPEVLKKDMRPFLALYGLLVVSLAVAMRVATVRTSPPSDQVFGSYISTLFAFEEGIHGPDVQWRTAVQGHSPMAGFVFILFLWVTIIMMTILIAMFTDTFEELRVHTYERFLHRRAVFAICTEKLMPVSVHQWCGYTVGDRISTVVFEDHQRRLRTLRRWRQVSALRTFLGPGFPDYMRSRVTHTRRGEERSRDDRMQQERGEERSLLLPKNERWILWHGGWEKDMGCSTMHLWRESTSHESK